MKRLYRKTADAKLGGVCSGLGEYLNIDPVIVRLIFLLLFFAGGLVAYIVAWIIVPEIE